MRRLILISAVVCFTSGCIVATLDNAGRAGSEGIVVVGWTPATCEPSVGATNATLKTLKITMGGREVKILSIRDVIDTEVETAEGERPIPTMTYRVAVIKIPEDMKPGMTEVRIYYNGKEVTDKNISPIRFEILEGLGRTRLDLPRIE